MKKTCIALALMMSMTACSRMTPAPGNDPKTPELRSGVVPAGEWVEVRMPDTLDLVDRADLSINALTGNVDPDEFYGVWQGFNFKENPPKLHAKTWNITPKNARTLPGLRAMSGSEQNARIELQMLETMKKEIRPNGQMYYQFDGSGPPKGTSYPQINALTYFAMTNYHARDKNPGWLEWMDKLAKGLRASAIQVEDRAYFPMQSGIDKHGDWHFMHHQGDVPIPYTPPDEPKSDAQGLEGAAKSDQIRCMSALVKHYQRTGDLQSLDIARKILKFVMKPAMWDDTGESGFPGHEHGVWSGHFHNGTQALMGLLTIAEATDDDKLRQIVREGYNHALQNGIARIGWFPAWSYPARFNRPATLLEVPAPCALADTACLAVLMTDAGLGDYWDDVESVVRNTLLAQQVTDLEKFRLVSGVEKDTEGHENLKRFNGGFVNGTLTHLWNDMPGCCTANGGQAIYYAWHGITRFDRGIATVNMFLNRVSPWMDVASHLPYEGRVELHNRQARTAMVRIPRWVDEDDVRVSLNGRDINPPMTGRYMIIYHLKKGDRVALEFPIRDTVDHYVINNKSYAVHFRGNTVMKIDTPEDHVVPDHAYRIYERGHLSGDRAPMRTVMRYMSNELVPLGTF